MYWPTVQRDESEVAAAAIAHARTDCMLCQRLMQQALKLHGFARKVHGAAAAGLSTSERATLRSLLSKAMGNLSKLEQPARSA